MHGAHLTTLPIGDQQRKAISGQYDTDYPGLITIDSIGLTPG
jgi:hypothetical protein